MLLIVDITTRMKFVNLNFGKNIDANNCGLTAIHKNDLHR